MIQVPDYSTSWVPLAEGVRVLVAPAGEVELAAARSWARRKLAQMEGIQPLDEELPALPAAPGAPDAEGAEQTPRLIRDTIWNALLTRALASLCIQSWEGVEGECTPARAAALVIMPGMGGPFLEAVLRAYPARSAEGNGSAPAPNGTSEAGQTTAEPAGQPG